eukprot:tig00000455_g996.t1
MGRFPRDPNLMEFYGIGCDHCEDMQPLIHQVEAEIGRSFVRYEVWENPRNLKILQKLDRGMCGGIPFFYNRKTRDYICGATTADNLKAFALGKPHDAFTQPPKEPKTWDDTKKELESNMRNAVKQAQTMQGEALKFAKNPGAYLQRFAPKKPALAGAGKKK